jgi:hypothetical protein
VSFGDGSSSKQGPPVATLTEACRRVPTAPLAGPREGLATGPAGTTALANSVSGPRLRTRLLGCLQPANQGKLVGASVGKP